MELPPPRVEQECKREGFGWCMNSHMYDWMLDHHSDKAMRDDFLKVADPTMTSKQYAVDKRKKVVEDLEEPRIPEENLIENMEVDGYRDEAPPFQKLYVHEAKYHS